MSFPLEEKTGRMFVKTRKKSESMTIITSIQKLLGLI